MKKPSLMAVFAHPDDEAFGVGGTLAKYAAAGCDAWVVAATRGEAGEIADPALATPSSLPAVRERELRCACQQYGIHPPLFLDYQDGLLTVVRQGQAVARLVRLIRQLQPDVLLTFGPEGIYGHYDHLAVHRWATAAYDLAADPEFLPGEDDGPPFQVAKLYYGIISQNVLEARAENGQRQAVMMDGVPFPFVGVPDAQITTVVDVSDHVDAKLRGILCHATQIGPGSRFATASEEVLNDPWFRQEAFVLARSTAPWPAEREGSLFVGVG